MLLRESICKMKIPQRDICNLKVWRESEMIFINGSSFMGNFCNLSFFKSLGEFKILN